ncbi:phage uncharacterized protein TIGR01671 [Sporobacter termitidis DSM 10068]|uniref:Phage uncharacterized protein TIGR01671 n=1 Tax=Sporobacter termitidis DSM 10068 TaxID=1123282 RepID=A0A1M5ZHV7_9FIRM|nr:YopX family protein [Sporobacter termitidis]SHI23802.1 phage uncharacterized protein TIGR01671 [Sporobacter termitidis DSM 10068]
MREILFRGKRTVLDNSEWIYGYGAIDNEILTLDFAKGIIRVEVEKGTVGQFTGLCDKNGKKIFEGDILGGTLELVTSRGNPTGSFSESRHVAEWGDEQSGFIARQTYESRYPKFYADKKPLGILKIVAEYYPIIGNIHDSPELLGKEGSPSTES